MQVINSKKLNVKTVGVKYGNSQYKSNNSKIVEDLIIRYKMDYDLFFFQREKYGLEILILLMRLKYFYLKLV